MPAIPYPGSMPRLHNCRKKKNFSSTSFMDLGSEIFS